MPLQLPPELLAKLRARREALGGGDTIEREHDAFEIYVGITAEAIYLTSGGEILSHDHLDAVTTKVTEENEVISSLVVGAEKTGISELLDLLPPRRPDALDCPLCDGERFMKGQLPIICLICWGRGWTTRAMIDAFGPIHDYLKTPK